MVHPSTGYHACRMMAAATDLSRAIGSTLRSDAATNTLTSTGSCNLAGTPDKVAAAAYRTMWSQSNRGQRDFQVSMRSDMPIVSCRDVTSNCSGIRRRLFDETTGEDPERCDLLTVLYRAVV